jgi:outer membrane biosynthesis protein TonB
MDRFNALGRGLQLMLVGSVLLLIDTFFDWQSVDTPLGTFGQSAWHGFGGVLLGLLTIVLVAWLFVRLAAVDIPLPVSATLIAAFLAFLILIIAILKNLVDDYSAWPSYVGIVLAAVIAVGAWMQIQATGGMESLKTEATSMVPATAGPSTQAPPAPSEPTTPVPSPPPAPEPPAAQEPMAAPEPTPPPAPEQAPPSESSEPASQSPGQPSSAEGASEEQS